MMRAFVIALFTFVVLLATPFSGSAAAQPPPSYPLEFTGGTPGVSIEIFLNAGKVGDTTLNTTGSGDFILNLANAGKTRVEIYVDVCKDGKVIQVKFVTGNGQATPEDESCRRRIAAISFQSDCGVIRINFDFTNFGARVVGCGLTIRDPKVYGPLGATAVLIPILLSGGDDTTTAAGTTPNPPTATTPPAATPPPATPPSTTPPATPPPATPPATEFSGSLTGVATFHPPGSSTSIICGLVAMTPAISGATWILTATGPGVLPNQNVNGNFNANGQSRFQIGISSFGPYALQVNITVNNVTRTASANHNVTSASGSCP